MRTIICFGEDWGRHPSTLQFIARELVKDYVIIWVESLGMRRPRMTRADWRRIWVKLRKWWWGPVRDNQVGGNLIVYTPIILPFHGTRVAQSINRVVLSRAIRRLVRNHSTDPSPILVTANPSTAYLIGYLGEAKSIYYCADEYAQMPGVDPVVVRSLEARLLQKVDAIVTTSESLFRTRTASGKAISLLRHGVDVEHFSHATRSETPVHQLLHAIRRPIFGFHGLIQDIIDFDLIESAAGQRPDWSFVFIGARGVDLTGLPSGPNIHYLPAQPYEAMPFIIRGFDVCLIPYRVNEQTRDRNPVKLREYLASGKPVLSTPLPEVMLYRDVVAFARTAEEFIKCGDKLLQETGPEFMIKRIDRVRGESWGAVARRFQEVLDRTCT